jgi:hypothetical protein
MVTGPSVAAVDGKQNTEQLTDILNTIRYHVRAT